MKRYSREMPSTKRQRVTHRVGVLSSVSLSCCPRINKFIYTFFYRVISSRDRIFAHRCDTHRLNEFTSYSNHRQLFRYIFGRSCLMSNLIHVSFPRHILRVRLFFSYLEWLHICFRMIYTWYILEMQKYWCILKHKYNILDWWN